MNKIKSKFRLLIGVFFLVYSIYPLLSSVSLLPYIFFGPIGIWNIIDSVSPKKGYLNRAYHPGLWIAIVLWGLTIAYICLFKPVYAKDPMFYLFSVFFIFVLFMSSYEHKRMKKYQSAIEPYEKAIEINPQNGAAWNNKGAIMTGFKAFQEAIKCFDKALEINPKDAAARYNKGIILMEIGRLKEAIEHYNTALQVDPGFKNAKNAGEIILEIGQL